MSNQINVHKSFNWVTKNLSVNQGKTVITLIDKQGSVEKLEFDNYNLAKRTYKDL